MYERSPERRVNNELLAEGRAIVAKRNVHHVALIVDGNRRWAQQQGLPSLAGHRRALEVVMERVADGVSMGIPIMSFWLFSTENWSRGNDFTSVIFDLGREVSLRVEETLMRLDVKFKHIGRKDRLPFELQTIITHLEEGTERNTGLTVLAAIDYGGRDEIRRAANTLVVEQRQVETDEEFSRVLDTAETLDPDFVIRTSGEQRTSGFMPWQTVYSEWYFPKTLFPDFSQEEFIVALRDYVGRQRRFGG